MDKFIFVFFRFDWKIENKWGFSILPIKLHLPYIYKYSVSWYSIFSICTSFFAKNVDLASSKSDVDKLDIDKLKNLPTNLSNLKVK